MFVNETKTETGLILKKKLGGKPFHIVNMQDNVREVLTIIGFLD